MFKEGSMIGLNDRLLHNYVEWIANRRMKAIGLDPVFDQVARNNPLPWTQHWLNSKGQQNAPQETEIESYVVGGIKQDVKQTPSQDSLSNTEWLDKTYNDLVESGNDYRSRRYRYALDCC